MLAACVLDHKGSWEEYLPLVEFAYNNSYQASIQMTPYEALYGRPCQSPICWTEVEDSSITSLNLIRDTLEKVGLIRQRLLMTQNRQKSYANRRRQPLEFEVGDHVFLKVMPKRGVVKFDQRWKLSQRFIGPFEILDVAPLSRPDPFGGSEPSPSCSNVTQSPYQNHLSKTSHSITLQLE